MAAMRTLRLIGKTSNDIFTLRYPNSLLDFCDFDFSAFASGAIDVCNEALKTGTPDYDRITDLRHDIQAAHCYIEHNIRTTYEKIVFDCWIDYVCRRDNIGVSGMWNRYIRCKTPFEKAIFARLCEFRYNRAINEWLNIIRVQDYAKTKLDFIFTNRIGKIEDASARRNYFDLIFSVTAREMGCRIEDLGVTKMFSVGRIPTAPFMFPNLSKEIVRHVLPNFDYSDDYSDIGNYSEISDQIAMDAFSRMKAGLPNDLENYNVPAGKLDKFAEKIYMPCSLKAAIDLEIDVLIEEGSWLSRCKRCKRFFLRNSEHPEEYCSRSVHNGKTCLQIYEEEHPRPSITPQLEERCRRVTDEVYSRVDKTMSLKEYDSWHLYLEAMIGKVKNGEIPPAELESFLDYSLEVDISKSRPIVEVAKREPDTQKERVVKPFIPQRISRSELNRPAAQEAEDVQEPEELPRRQQPKEGFFTSPSFQRQKSERAPISHIIRNGESMGESYTKKPDPAGFTPFGTPEPAEPQIADKPRQSADIVSLPVREEQRRRTPREELKRLEERIEENNRLRREQAERARSTPVPNREPFKPFFSSEGSGASEDRSFLYDRGENGEDYGRPAVERDIFPQSRRDREREIRRQQSRSAQTPAYSYDNGEPDYENLDSEERRERFEHGDHEIRLNRKDRSADTARYNTDERKTRFSEYERGSEPIKMNKSPSDRADEVNGEEEKPFADAAETAAPRRRVIRKNAAALSAYGKMSGAQFETVRPERGTAPQTDKEDETITEKFDEEPFKDIGSIFDVLEQSQAGSRDHRRLTDDDLAGDIHNDASDDIYDDSGDDIREETYDNEPQRTSERRRTRRTQSVPREVTEDNVPEGIWTEDRGLFPETRRTAHSGSGTGTKNASRTAQRSEKNPRTRDIEPLEDDVTEGFVEIGDEGGSEGGKEKRHTRSNKTQRLFDVIMREPDDNPNFRK